LHYVFGFAWISQDAESNAQDKAMIAVKEDGEGVRVAVAKMHDECFVRQAHETGEARLTVFFARLTRQAHNGRAQRDLVPLYHNEERFGSILQEK